MKRTNLPFFSATLWLMMNLGTFWLDANLSLVQSSPRVARRLPPPPSIKNPTRRSDEGARLNCSHCPKKPISPVPVVAAKPSREYVFQAPYPVRPAKNAVVVNNRRSLARSKPTVTVARKLPPLPVPNRRESPPQRSVISKKPTVIVARKLPPLLVPNRRESPLQRSVISTNQLFRVEVKINSAEALARIKAIEPLAFIRFGENVIQAGLFNQQRQAQQRVKELVARGFPAQIVTLNTQRF